MAEGERTWISPTPPGSKTAPSAMPATRSDTPSGASPAESSRHSSGRPTGLAAITGTSLAP